VEFASERSKETHLRAEDGLGCILEENKLLNIIGEDLLAIELMQMCRYCGGEYRQYTQDVDKGAG